MSGADRPTLGVVSISYNEERDIGGFLENLSPWVDEIVIVDDGSTDQTQAMAEVYGDKVKFLKTPRKDGEYFSHQRSARSWRKKFSQGSKTTARTAIATIG